MLMHDDSFKMKKMMLARYQSRQRATGLTVQMAGNATSCLLDRLAGEFQGGSVSLSRPKIDFVVQTTAPLKQP